MPVTTAFETNDLDPIMEEMFSLVQSKEPIVTAALCADKGNSCQSPKTLNSSDAMNSRKVFSVSSCSSGESLDRDVACEDDCVTT